MVQGVIDKIYKKHSIKIAVVFTPLFMLCLLLGTTVYYNYFDSTYYKIYPILTSLFGNSTILVLCYGYILSKVKFCLYSKISWFGLLYYNMLNLADSIFDIGSTIYFGIVEISGMSITLLLALIYLLKRK